MPGQSLERTIEMIASQCSQRNSKGGGCDGETGCSKQGSDMITFTFKKCNLAALFFQSKIKSLLPS